MKTISQKLYSSFLVALAFLSIIGVSSVFAAPSQPPSSGAGVDLPLHIGSAGQTKSGALTIGGLLTANGNLNVGGTLSVPTLCLNGACNSGWPSASVTPNSVSASHTGYFNNYTYNNGYQYETSGSIQFNGSGSLINAGASGCPCVYSYSYGYNICPSSSNIVVSVTNFSSRTANYTASCNYPNYLGGTAYPEFTFSGITI